MAMSGTMLYIRLNKGMIKDLNKIFNSQIVLKDKSAMALVVEGFLEKMLCYAACGPKAEEELAKRALKEEMLSGKLNVADIIRKENEHER